MNETERLRQELDEAERLLDLTIKQRDEANARADLATEDRDAIIELCAQVAEGFPKNRDWVPGSLYDTLRREVAAAIRALKSAD